MSRQAGSRLNVGSSFRSAAVSQRCGVEGALLVRSHAFITLDCLLKQTFNPPSGMGETDAV